MFDRATLNHREQLFMGKPRAQFKSQRASYFHPVRVEKQPGPEFFWELTGAKVSIRLEITTCGE